MAEVRLSLYQAGRPETLPNVCVRCGAEAAGVVRRQFVWHPPPGVGPVRNRRPDLFVFLLSLATLLLTVVTRLLPGLDTLLYAEGRRRIWWWFVGVSAAAFAVLCLLLVAGIHFLWLFLIGTAMAFAAFVTLIYYADRDSPGLRGMTVTVGLPVCKRHRDHWERHQMTVLCLIAGLAGSATAFLIALVSPEADRLPGGQPTLLLLTGVCAAALLFGLVLVRLRPPVRAVEITEQTVTLAGVAPAFERALGPKIGVEPG
jgi:hypothetical protein